MIGADAWGQAEHQVFIEDIEDGADVNQQHWMKARGINRADLLAYCKQSGEQLASANPDIDVETAISAALLMGIKVGFTAKEQADG